MIFPAKIASSGSDFLRLEVSLSLANEKGSSEPSSTSSIMQSILVVDDDADMRSYMKDCLLDHYDNVYVMEAGDGQSAFRLLQNVKPALLITDLNMPVMNGLELIAGIVDNFEGWSVPVLIISGKDQYPATYQQIRELPSWDELKKPFSEEQLIRHVQPFLTSKP